MADRLMRAQVTIPLDNNNPDDVIVNTFYFDQDDNGLLPPPDTSYDAVVTSLEQFYGAFDQVLFPSTIAGTAIVRIYDMRDPEPRLLRRQENIDLTPSAADPLPGEVAVCLSFAAAPVAGVNPQRRRGRVYLGPVAVSVAETFNSHAHITGAVRAAIINGAESLVTPNDVGGSSLSWAMYSRTTDLEGANIDDSIHDVQGGWVDNAFDTQRRRGMAATTRDLFGS